jgi:hypothetical protein
VTQTGIPDARRRSTSIRRFSSWLASTRSGTSPAMAVRVADRETVRANYLEDMASGALNMDSLSCMGI